MDVFHKSCYPDQIFCVSLVFSSFISKVEIRGWQVAVTLITKEIFESGNLVVACFSGMVTMPEIEAYFYWLVETHGNGINDGFSQLVYSSDLEKVDIQVNDIHRLSHLRATVGRNSSGSRLALVVPDLKYYWMAKLYQTLSKSSHINTRIFREVDQSFAWLGFENPLIK